MQKRTRTSTVAALALFAVVGLVAALAPSIAWPNLARAHSPGDASLTALMVTAGETAQTLTPAFSSTVTDYTVAVANNVTQITIEATADGDGSVTYQNTDGTTLTDADTSVDGQQVDLPAAGGKRIDVVVTHGTDTQTYTVLVSHEGTFDSEDPCAGGGYNPTPTAVAVDAVPIVVESTTADYFVLYVRDLVDPAWEAPVSVTRGEAGTTSLTENVAALPKERYRVEKYLIADPADVDGDCIDDLTELTNLGSQNPVNAAAGIALTDGAVAIPDEETFTALSEVFASRSGGWTHVVKFFLGDTDTDRPLVYFMNTSKHLIHQSFIDAVGPELGRHTKGKLTYHPELVAPDGSQGLYYFSPSNLILPAFSHAERSYTQLAASMRLLDDNLAVYIPNRWLSRVQSDLQFFRASRMHLVFDEDLFSETDFQALNPGEGYGRLRALEPDERPHPREIVLYEALPNELPRVAGIISTVPQTPLSHVNLRAVQDGVPNAFIRGALDEDEIDDLIGSYVRYTVTETGYTIRAATKAEVDAHYASSRPTQPQTPERDLSVTAITPLSQIGFDDWDAFGVKAANVAVLGTLDFPEGTVPDGFAIPFYFYDEFMKHNGFYTRIETMLADSDFQTDFDTQESELKKLRKDIEDAETPAWIIAAIVEMNESFAEGVNRRYRSSTNNEDLPGFNGAGLYDSKSQKPSEDEKDLAKSLKEVYASLWNFRAFIERDFHRIDHTAAAMGILVHPSYKDEEVNGVAVSFDPVYDQDDAYYVNSQVGEDLVTNPDALSVPEEVLLHKARRYTILSTSNQAPPGSLLMSDDQLNQLRRHLAAIHKKFTALYNPSPDEPFAMEIEFKITSDDVLAIKQARPWVFGSAETVTPPSTNQAPVFTEDANTTRSVAETTAAGVNIGAPVAATDADNDALTYSLDATGAASFDISSTTGQLQTKADLDHETKSSYTVTVSVRDSKDGNGDADEVTDDMITVTIQVANLNEAPVFTPIAPGLHDVDENTVAGENIGAPVAATDDDNDTLTYSLDDSSLATFDIVATTGQLQTKAALDYETGTISYTVTVTAVDPSGADDTITVTITVNNVDEAGTVTLSSTQPIEGTPLTATLDDPDFVVSGSATWAWAGSPNGSSSSWTPINGATSASYTPVPADVGRYLRATASYTDGEGSGKSAQRVSANRVQPAPVEPNEPPEFPLTETRARDVDENTPAGEDIGEPVAATDPEGDTLTYSLDTAGAESFDIGSTTGQLQTKAALNFETTPSYSVTVTATDTGAATDTIIITITVNNLEEPGTVTLSSLQPLVAIPLTTTLDDPDVVSGSVTWSWERSPDGTSSWTLISGATSASYTPVPADVDRYLRATASYTDGEGSGKSAQAISAHAVELAPGRNAPVFTEGASTTRSIPENTPAGRNIGAPVSATDPDNDLLTYSLGGPDEEFFDIDASSGQLQTKTALDYESKSSYSVTVSVSDSKDADGNPDTTTTVRSR